MITLTLTLMIALFSQISHFQTNVTASEIDSFTNRDHPLKDSTDVANEMANEILVQAAKWANRRRAVGGGCLHSRLYKGLYDQISGLAYAKIEEDLEQNPEIEKFRPSLHRSIYRRIRLFEGPAMVISGLGSVLRIGEHLIGTDKFGHFFDTGYDYFKRAYLDRKGVKAALRFGEQTERGIYGQMTTGVYSYADLVANYQGMDLWRHLTERYALDPSKVYFQCVQGQWQQVRTFDWRDYIDAGWDEGINCSEYKGSRIRRIVGKAISRTGSTCPLSHEKCADLVERYGDLAPRLLSPKCRIPQ